MDNELTNDIVEMPDEPEIENEFDTDVKIEKKPRKKRTVTSQAQLDALARGRAKMAENRAAKKKSLLESVAEEKTSDEPEITDEVTLQSEEASSPSPEVKKPKRQRKPRVKKEKTQQLVVEQPPTPIIVKFV